jgi:hypothetical protein
LVQNVTERGLVALLLQPLAREQGAPVGYLLPSRVVVLLFGESEFALRLVPSWLRSWHSLSFGPWLAGS